MDNAQEELVIRWLTSLVDPATVHTHKFDTKHCYAIIKYLLDGKQPESTPTHYEMEKLYRMYIIVPEELVPLLDELMTEWKTRIYTDPEDYMTPTVSVVG